MIFLKNNWISILLIILTIPAFYLMIRPGIFSMSDPAVFRMFEYDKCIKDLQFPCRFSPDVAFEYGQPLFNFYGQLPFFIGETFVLLGVSILDTIKILFILSLLLSAISMYLLANQIWQNRYSALICAIIYTYAPYRAVDIYVRGALSEAWAFVFFPLIIYFFNRFTEKKDKLSLIFFSLLLAGLILTHNLSVLMFTPFLIVWGLYTLYTKKLWKLVPKILLAFLFTLGFTAFYVLPVIFESKFISIDETTKGYFDFRAHFVTLFQIFLSRYWGYGASLWGEDDRLSLSIGQIQWIVPFFIFIALFIKRNLRKYNIFWLLLGVGFFYLFMTHNKSAFIWEALLPLKYLQFPWRFLGLAVFCFSLSVGTIALIFKRRTLIVISILIIGLTIYLNLGFFKPDLWFNITDQQQFSGKSYEQQAAASLRDYWPSFAKEVPSTFAPKNPLFVAEQETGMLINTNGEGKEIYKKSNTASYLVIAETNSKVSFPIAYFPGWKAYINNKPLNVYPYGDLGLITGDFLPGRYEVFLKFENTLVRQIGNSVSIFTFVAVLLFLSANSKIFK